MGENLVHAGIVGAQLICLRAGNGSRVLRDDVLRDEAGRPKKRERASQRISETESSRESREHEVRHLPNAIKCEVKMPAKMSEIFEVACPECGALLRIDPESRAILSHTPAPRKRTFEDLETAARAMRDQEERKESIFRQSLDAEKNKQELLEKKFAEALRKAKESPDEGRPLRDFDLD